MSTIDSFLPTYPRTKPRTDAASLVCFYVVLLALIPARLVLAGLPLDVRPSMVVGWGLGLAWLCSHMVGTLGMAKGSNLVRTSIYLYGCTQLATYGVATASYLPPDELKSADLSLVTIYAAMAVGLLVCDGIRSVDRIDTVLRVIVIACAGVAIVGMIQFFVGVDPTKYLQVPGLRLSRSGGGDAVLARSIFRRPSGTAGHPIEFGVVCALAVPLAAHYAFRARDLGQSSRRWWICLLLVAMGAFVSLSRSAILGLIVAALFLLPTWPAKRRRQTFIAAGVFLVVVYFAVRGLIGTLLSLFSNLSSDPSIQGRTNDYATTSQSISQHPWLGKGFGTWLFNKYGPLDNQYLGTIVENGYLGLVFFIVLFLAAMISAAMARRATNDPHIRDLAQTLLCCVAMLGVSSATYDQLAFRLATGLMFITLGACGALYRILRSDRPRRSPLPPPTATAVVQGSAPGGRR